MRGATVDEVVLCGYADHEEDERWASLRENISALTAENFSNAPGALAAAAAGRWAR